MKNTLAFSQIYLNIKISNLKNFRWSKKPHWFQVLTLSNIVGLIAALYFAGAFHVIDSGHIGVYKRGGALLNTWTEPGLHFMVPFLTNVQRRSNVVFPSSSYSSNRSSQKHPCTFLLILSAEPALEFWFILKKLRWWIDSERTTPIKPSRTIPFPMTKPGSSAKFTTKSISSVQGILLRKFSSTSLIN